VAELLRESGKQAQDVCAVAVHGQTIRHRPELGFTRQTNNPALLAELCGIDVIADFRSRDVAAGGQGAPLVPAFHQACSASRDRRVVANIGGIANISVLAGDGSVIGFDTGPGNVLMDGWMHRHKARSTMPTAPGRPAASAAGSAGGTAREPYLAPPAPKSTGRDLFHLDWLDARLAVHAPAPPEDVQRTLTHYTAVTLADAIKAYGGGADAGLHLRRRRLQQRADGCAGAELGKQVLVASTQALGVAPNRGAGVCMAGIPLQRAAGGQPAGRDGGKRRARLGALYPR
jgi:anhydro-N-acetylmuramic acid kinase